MRAAIVGALISAALAGAARTPGEQLHYAFASVGCSAGSGTFPDLASINEVARNLGGSEAKGQRCFDDHFGVVLNSSAAAAGVDYEPLESKPGDDADFNDGMTDGFTIELWLTPMATSSSSDQVVLALEQREPGAASIVCTADSDCGDVCSCTFKDTDGNCSPGTEGTCDLTCSNKADGPVGFRLVQKKQDRGGGDKAELTLEYKFSEDGASKCNRFPPQTGVVGCDPCTVLGMVGPASSLGLALHEGGSMPTPQHVVISVNGNLAAPGPLEPPRLLLDFFTVRASTGSRSACLPRVPYDACAALWSERFSTPLGSSAAIAPARARRARRRARGQSHH